MNLLLHVAMSLFTFCYVQANVGCGWVCLL